MALERFTSTRAAVQERISAASFTVEASLILPLILLALLTLLFLTSYVHDRSVLTSSACIEAVSDTEDTPFLILLQTFCEKEKESSPSSAVVRCRISVSPFFVSPIWEKEVEMTYRVCDPVPVILRTRAARHVIDSVS